MLLVLYSKLYNEDLWAAPLILCALLLFGLFALYRRIKPYHVPKQVPGPPRLPFLGISKFIKDNLECIPSIVAELSSNFNRTWGGPVPVIGCMSGAYFFVVDETSVRYILQDRFENYIKGKVTRRALGELLGDGIFAIDGKKWRVHRKIASNMFSRNLLRHSADVMEAKLTQVVGIFLKGLEEEHVKGNLFINIDLQDLFFRITLDSFVNTAFGVELDSLNRKRQHPFALAFDKVQSLCHKRYKDPFFEIKRWCGLCLREQTIKSQVIVIDRFANDVINSKRRSSKYEHDLGADLISRFFEKSYLHEADEPSNKELRDIVMNFVLAGRDTTACALTWMFYELGRNLEVVKKVIDEVEDVCGVAPNSDYSYESLNKLEYVHAVVMEVLRLHPPVPTDMKYAVNDDTLPDGTFVPAGAAVVYSPFAMGRSKKIWGKDAEEFKPERFYKQQEPSAFKFVAFNAGPRTCLGKPLALMNMKMALAILLPKFTFQDVAGHSGDYEVSLVLRMKNGFPVRVSNRNQ